MSLRDTQTGGNHYKGMGIQPIEFAYANQWDPCAFSALKYLTRHRMKAGFEDLQKARDFVSFRTELMNRYGLPEVRSVISMDQYVRANSIPDPDSDVLRGLEFLVLVTPDECTALDVDYSIRALQRELYGKDNP